MSYLPGVRGEGLSPDRVFQILVGQQPQSLATGDFDGDGVLDLAVANGLSDNVSHLRGGFGGLRPVGTLGAGNAPAVVISGDFDADGFTDVAIASEDSDTVTYARGGGSGLQREFELNTFDEPVAVTAGDYDNDGFADVVVASDRAAILTYLRGGGQGLAPDFAARIEVRRRTTALESGHFDGDEFIDVLTLSRQGRLFYSRGGSSGLANERTEEFDTGAFPGALASGDYDGDGYLDVVVANRNSNDLTYLRGSKAGLAATDEAGEEIPPIPVEELPEALTNGDYDGDGFVDLAVANRDSGSVSYLRGSEDGLVARTRKGEPIPSIRVGRCPSALTSADYDGDGFPDVVVANRGTENLTYLRGGWEGLSFARTGSIPVGFSPVALASGDYDGDGFPDVIAVGIVAGSVDDFCGEVDFPRPGRAIYLRGGPTGPLPAGEVEVGQSPVSLVSGDFSGDGFLDAMVLNRLSDDMTFLRGGTEGPRRTGGAIAAGSEPVAGTSGDYDGDGFLDVAVINEASNSVTYLRQRFLTPHVNILLDGSSTASPQEPLALEDPRRPIRYRLSLDAGAFDVPTQVSVVPGPHFDIAQGEAHHRGAFLTVVTDPVALQRDGTPIRNGGSLTLRLRDQGRYSELLEAVLREPARLRVFRKNSETGRSEDMGLNLGPEAIVEFEGGKGVVFPIVRFGVYLVAFERDRY